MWVIMCHMIHCVFKPRKPRGISWSCSHQARDQPIKKASPPPDFFRLIEAIPKIFVFRVLEVISLHFRFYDIERVAAYPIYIPCQAP